MPKALYDITVLGSGHCHSENRTGVYRVCLNALDVLYKKYKENLYLTSFVGNDIECLQFLEAHYPELKNKFKHAKKFKLIDIIRKRYNICISPYFKIPSNYRYNLWCKNVIIIYDLIQVLHPEWCQENCFKDYSKFLKTLNKQTFAICISEYTKKDLLEYKTKLNKKKVSVIPLGVDEKYHSNYTKEQIQSVKDKYGIKTDKYFFSISSMNPRKNFKHTVLGFIEFIEKYEIKDVALVLAGPKGWGDIFDGIDLEKYKEQIILTGFADEEDLPLLYAGAEASVYLSLYEGFGLPPLESIYCNTPPIAANVTSIPEVVGNAGILISPEDLNALVESYKTIYDGKFDMGNFKIEAEKQKSLYNWSNFEKVLLESLK